MFRKLSGLFKSPEPENIVLTRVYSEKKRGELYRILHDTNPRHNARLWMAGFLKFAGYRLEDIEQIIARENRWANYDPHKTSQQLRSVFNSATRSKEVPVADGGRRRRPPSDTGTSSLARSNPDQQYTSRDRLNIDTLNREFLYNASEVVSEHPGPGGRSTYSWGREPRLDPARVPLYRTIEGRGHLLAVLDIDADGDLPRAWRVMQRLMAAHRFRWAKFSGTRGFHGIDVLRYAGHDEARRHVGHVCSLVDMEGLRPDERMFRPRQLIRAFSLNLKSGRCSVPVRPAQSLDEILKSSEAWRAG
jgi:hypothetical protein